jgi:glycerol-3-phosphate dehydrogenase
MSRDEYEVIIIGGGITGATIARDCARRGFKILLLEKKDFGAGTSGGCTGMIHGGLQYMISERVMSVESCTESGIVQQEAPHLIFRIPFLHTFREGGIEELKMYGPVVEDYDELGKLKYSQPHVELSAEEVHTLEPSLSPDIQGALTLDEPGIDTFRLVMANVLDAAEHGATVRNHAQVIDILRDGDRIYGVQVRDTLTDKVEEVHATYVVNAAGPWTPWVAELADVPFELRPIKGMHIVFDRRFTSVAVGAEMAALIPHENGMICGISNDFYFSNPDEVRTFPDEVEELLCGLEKVIPDIREARIIRTYAGVRPTLPDPNSKDQRAVSRNFEIFDHGERDGVQGFITIAGGKLVIARLMAEKLTDLLCQKFGRDVPCRTHEEPLAGGERQADPADLADEFGVPMHTAARIVHRHGARAYDVLELTRDHPQYKSHVCVCEPVTEAEIRYSIRHEWARTLDDLRRRNRLGMGPCQGFHCTKLAATILADELDSPAARVHADVLDFLQSRWRGRHPALRGSQLRQEEVHRACYLCLGGYHNPELERASRW